MQFIKQKTNYDFMGSRRPFLMGSLIFVLLSLGLAFGLGPKFGIDFAGGTEIQVDFKENVTTGQLRSALDALNYPGAEVVTFGSGDSEFLIRLQQISTIDEKVAAKAEKALNEKFADKELSQFDVSPGGDKLTIKCSGEVPIAQLEEIISTSGMHLGDEIDLIVKQEAKKEGDEASNPEEVARAKRCESATCTWPFQDLRVYEVNLKGVTEGVMEGLRSQPFGAGAVKMRSEWVGPKVGKQLRNAGFWSLIYALAFIMLYIAIRFDVRFAPGAVVALIHDILITVGIFTIARVEVTLATVAALLTIVGYSLNDTIVVFDRIRENLTKLRERNILQVINVSINETLSRTILTSITTLIAVVAILIIGWNTTIRDFAFALLIGVFVGTYSSIFIASPVVVWLDRRFAKKKA